MDFILKYLYKKRRDLADKVLELYQREELDTTGDDIRYKKGLNEFSSLYKKRLIGLECDMMEIGECLQGLLSWPAHSITVYIVYQRIMFIHLFLLQNELYELFPRFVELNLEISEVIRKIRPDMHIAPLLSEDNFKAFETDLIKLVQDYRNNSQQKTKN